MIFEVAFLTIRTLLLTIIVIDARALNDYKLYGTHLCVEDTKTQQPNGAAEIGETVTQGTTQFSEVIKQLVDKLTGKDMEFTYDFQNLEIDVPRVTGPEGKELASAKWKINGKFVPSTALLNANSSESNERPE